METVIGKHDVIIIGGGPAGISAAISCADLGMRALLVERNDELGGQLLWTYNSITDFPGEASISGHKLASRFADQVRDSEVGLLQGIEISVDLSARSIATTDGAKYSADALIIATGVRRRTLGVPGEDAFVG